MVSFKGNKGKPGRPRGQQHDAEVHVRLPREVLKVLQKLSRQWDASVSEVVRAMIVVGMLNLAGKAAKVITGDQSTTWQRLRAISRHRQLRRALLHLTDTGLKLARANALAADGRGSRNRKPRPVSRLSDKGGELLRT